jgi:saccharopine dehydrogenase-like NADP-dependent oxidoreductase
MAHMHSIIVLGAGMVGSTMAIDLSKNHRVTLTDISEQRLQHLSNKNSNITYQVLDVCDGALLQETVKPFDLVVCAVPGFLGYQTMKLIIEAGKHVVDISFFPEDALQLDALAKANNVTAIVDCGVAPGMGNFILGRYNQRLQITDFECLVGGLPKIKKWPFAYKAPFSPVDVIEEYTRPARYVENGQLITRDALSDAELVEFDEVGTLESFNSDGLRSIIFTMPHIRNMKEKTLRYPGHIEYIKVLKSSGFFDTKPLMVNGKSIAPLDFTSAVLFNEWKLGETEPELTIMRISITGKNDNGATEKIVYDLFDEYDPITQTSSMARTTGYTATAAANMFLNGMFNTRGIFPPELIGHDENCFQFILQYLAERNVHYKKSTSIL